MFGSATCGYSACVPVQDERPKVKVIYVHEVCECHIGGVHFDAVASRLACCFQYRECNLLWACTALDCTLSLLLWCFSRCTVRARTAPLLYTEPSTMLFQPVYSPGTYCSLIVHWADYYAVSAGVQSGHVLLLDCTLSLVLRCFSRCTVRARTAPWLYTEPSTTLFQPVYSPGTYCSLIVHWA